jgi:hypothetical protein
MLTQSIGTYSTPFGRLPPWSWFQLYAQPILIRRQRGPKKGKACHSRPGHRGDLSDGAVPGGATLGAHLRAGLGLVCSAIGRCGDGAENQESDDGKSGLHVWRSVYCASKETVRRRSAV